MRLTRNLEQNVAADQLQKGLTPNAQLDAADLLAEILSEHGLYDVRGI